MLPLHTTIRNLLSISTIILIFTSCSHESEKNLAIIKTLDESLAYSNKLLNVSTSEILISLNEKLNERSTQERAKIWFQKAQTVEAATKEVNNYIEKIKVELLEKGGKNSYAVRKLLNRNADGIYEGLMNYKETVLATDDRIHKQFSRSLVVVSSLFDTLGKNGTDLFNTFFDNENIYPSKAMLTKLQNNVKVIENKVIMFCHEQVGAVGGPCISMWPIIGQSSTIVQAGERIELTAGIGSFYFDFEPHVSIYGKEIPITERGLAVYKLKASSKPGKYYVPVKINYTDQDGKQITVQKEIEYTVANIQKQ